MSRGPPMESFTGNLIMTDWDKKWQFWQHGVLVKTKNKVRVQFRQNPPKNGEAAADPKNVVT